ALLNTLGTLVGPGDLLTDAENLEKYGQDETEDLLYKPEVVLRPQTVSQISEIMKLANANRIAVTVRGAGTGLSGGALPVHGGIV
ncbi:UNVERIFIED_CONTAM: FAD-binding oxidoreductase, partial [Salmonella enterica subsp. enterica serovar Weltevreden]